MADADELTVEDLERYASGELDVRERARIQLLIENSPTCKQAWQAYRDREKLAEELRASGILRFDDNKAE